MPGNTEVLGLFSLARHCVLFVTELLAFVVVMIPYLPNYSICVKVLLSLWPLLLVVVRNCCKSSHSTTVLAYWKITFDLFVLFLLVQRVGISVKEIIWPSPWHRGLWTSCRGPQCNAVATFSFPI